MFKILVPFQLAFFVVFTGVAFSAQLMNAANLVEGSIPSQQTTDAIQNVKLYALESKLDTNTVNLAELNNQYGLMRSSMDRAVGIGIGLGCALTMLQALQLVLGLKLNTVRKPKEE